MTSLADLRGEIALILTPAGRDAQIASSLLGEAGIESRACRNVEDLCRELAQGAGFALLADNALHNTDIGGLALWVSEQPPWSDFPFVLLTERGGGLERNPQAFRLTETLGNVIFLERPFHPTSLVSVARTALRARRRQYEARQRIDEIREAETLLERRVEERTAELGAANRQLVTQIEEREKVEAALRQAQRLEAVGQLTSGVAHDFNNLLTVVLGNVRQLAKAEADPTTLRRLDMMEQAAQRGAKLTAQLLAFSRRQKLEPQLVNLNQTVESMRDLLQSTMASHARIETELDCDLWGAMIDPTQIELVILNLAINARDAMEVGGVLTVGTANVTLGQPRRAEEPPPGDYVMVAVSDTGTGMSSEVLAKVFEPFFTTKAVGKGSGLGLSQVFGLAKQSGGGVRIDTAPGEGTSVKVYLPRCDDMAAPRALPPEAPRGIDGRPVVLLVDDDSAVREITAGMLDELGYCVVEAGSGGAALETLQQRPDIDLMLLDFAMPGMNGAEVAREAITRRPHLPIVFVTGYADVEALAHAGDAGVIQKPFEDHELASKLRAVLESLSA
ncbi:MAG: response regulator [Phenylobacterium sp.]|uniref:response regulator n=1 Tax=Phenylobacterium sp. TaxID=1871053 RepID=UPI00272F8B8F|nr:response regulator [Phenylobacterium sp.]MDP2008788.1 response regulator [Phenylobacterium sp.]MDP3632465.1 response regulator [Phenylobacterium sp.]MDP3869536.1 response regulator [Phenylobacterium sp.]